MGWLKKIWIFYDSLVGRILAIFGSLGLIAGAIIVIVVFISNLLDLDKPDCFSKDLSFSDFEECVFDEREIYKKDFFVKEWTGKRITSVAKFGPVLPHDDSKFGDSPESDNRVMVLLLAWGPEKNYGQNFIKCNNNFKSGDEASRYWNSLKKFDEGDKVRFTGKIAKVTRENLLIDECLVLERASN